eukprot:ANDGO_02920.mRNA.1 hypothetical protein SARC_07475
MSGIKIGVSVVLALSKPVTHNTPLLLITRGKQPALGLLSFPGGGLELRETMQDGSLRELHEECGIPPAAVEYHGPFYATDAIGPEYHYVIVQSLGFLQQDSALFSKSQVRALTDAAAVHWMTPSEILAESPAKFTPNLHPVIHKLLSLSQYHN